MSIENGNGKYDNRYLFDDCEITSSTIKDESLKLRGQMIFVKELDALVYLASPM